jgi:NAD(P)H-hydrate repair Nnr-like enzyme with NAD(P)H-hydrate dehydratase domain
MDYLKQVDQPAFPKLLWNRPISRSGAGRLLIIGGHRDEFHDVQTVYRLAFAAGIGSCRVILPDSLRKLLSDIPDTSFVPSTNSGSISKLALGEILSYAESHDAIMIGPNLSNNSETAILIESILQKFSGPVIMGNDAVKLLKHQIKLITDRKGSLLVGSMIDFFGIANDLKLPLHIKDGGTINKLEIMKQLQDLMIADSLLVGRDMITAADGKLSHTPSVSAMDFFTNPCLALAAVWFVQNPNNHFEALTTAAYILKEARAKLVTTKEKALTVQEIEKAIETVMRSGDF